MSTWNEDRDAWELATAREVLALFRPGFAMLPEEDQIQEAASFVLERREELARCLELQRWLACGMH